jgi:hypothetical protein
VVSKSLLKKTYENHWHDVEQALREKGNLIRLKELPFIIFHDRNGLNTRYLKMIFEKSGFLPVVGFRSGNGELNAAMCIYGAGAYIGPYDLCLRKFGSYLNSGDDSLILFTLNIPNFNSAMALSYEKGKRLHPAEKNFIETAINYLANHTTAPICIPLE